MSTTWKLALAFVLLGLTATTHGARDESCPNERARNCPRVVSTSGMKHCGLGIQIFGWEIGLRTSACPDFKFVTPPNQKCFGDPMWGHQCALDAEVTVERWKCDCVDVSVLGTGLLLPQCECELLGFLGTIEDYKTAPCDDD